MSIDFTFTRAEGSYHASFEETHTPTEKEISVGGRNYKILGSEKDIEFLRSQLANVNDFESMEHLEATLSHAGPYMKTESIFQKTVARTMPSGTIIQTEKGSAMHTLLQAWVKDHDFAGVVMAIDEETVILKQGYGKAREGDTQPISPNTRLPIGSLTKPITCEAISQLVQEKKFSGQTNPAEIKALQFLPDNFRKHMDQGVLQLLKDVTLLDLMN
ncbi:MAG: serine hydrolase, partial [Verrucomicrobia bacterium]|nr:serine hydrolase [Verrucomicrobiota bacterium]